MSLRKQALENLQQAKDKIPEKTRFALKEEKIELERKEQASKASSNRPNENEQNKKIYTEVNESE